MPIDDIGSNFARTSSSSFSKADGSAHSAGSSREKYSSEEYFAPPEQMEDFSHYSPFIDKSAQLSAYLSFIGKLNMIKVLNQNRDKKQKNQQEKEKESSEKIFEEVDEDI